MKKIFIDFETDGLNGDVTEISFLLDKNKILTVKDSNLEYAINKFSKKFKIKWNDEFVIIFWHRWHLDYLSKNYAIIYELLKGRFVNFIDAYSLVNKLEKQRYSIEEATFNLCKRNHVGNSLQDVIDLYDCYNKLINYCIIPKI